LFSSAGFTGEALDVALGVAYAESEGYSDAVGDIELAELGPYATEAAAVNDVAARKAAGRPFPNPGTVVQRGNDWFVVNTKWGPSVGLFQIRALDDPNAWGPEDKVRIADRLRDPAYNAYAGYVISKQGTDWSKWSVFKSGAYLKFAGKDFTVRTGHPRAGEWSK